MQRSRNWLTLTGFKNSNLTIPEQCLRGGTLLLLYQDLAIVYARLVLHESGTFVRFHTGRKRPGRSVARARAVRIVNAATAPSPQAQRRLIGRTPSSRLNWSLGFFLES